MEHMIVFKIFTGWNFSLISRQSKVGFAKFYMGSYKMAAGVSKVRFAFVRDLK